MDVAINRALAAAQNYADEPSETARNALKLALSVAVFEQCGPCKLTDTCQNPAVCIERGKCMWAVLNESIVKCGCRSVEHGSA